MSRLRDITICLICLLLMITCGVSVFIAMRVSENPGGMTSMQVADTLQNRLIQMVNATATVNPPAGKSGTASVDGNDAVGQVNITTGTNPTAGSLVHITFHTPYGVQPILVVSPLDQSPPPNWYVTVDTNGFDIVVGTAPRANTNYPFTYFIAARPWLMYLDS